MNSTKPVALGLISALLATCLYLTARDGSETRTSEAERPGSGPDSAPLQSTTIQTPHLERKRDGSATTEYRLSPGPIGEHAGKSDEAARRSACRIARDIDLCSRMDMVEHNAAVLQDAASSSWVEQASPDVADRVLAQAEALRFWSSRAKEICGASGQASREEALEYAYRAAVQGDVRSMVTFALGAPDLDAGLGPRSAELLAAHSRVGAKMLLDASLVGDPEALYAVFRANSDGALGSGQRRIRIAADHAVAIASGRMLAQLLPPQRKGDIERRLSELRNGLSATELSRAERLYSQYRKTHTKPITTEFTGYAIPITLDDPCADEGYDSDIFAKDLTAARAY